MEAATSHLWVETENSWGHSREEEMGITPPQRRLSIPRLFIFSIPFSALVINIPILPRFLAQEGETDFQRYFHCSLKIDFPFLITGSCSSHSSPISSLQ
ncbi:hypothetical protein Gotri_011558, partial [Gossypium trilobum]|nr:hypothetical protein [Gossypium trilobum]